MIAGRYTAVPTGLLSIKEPGECPYLSMGGDPFGPGGSGMLHRGRPPYELMGCEVPFEELPEGCRRPVLDTSTRRSGASERSATYDEEEYLARLPERLVLIFDGA